MTDAKLKAPRFEPQIPDELMAEWHTLSPVERCILKDQSIQKQQNDWIIKRLSDGDSQIRTLREDVDAIKRLRDILTAKWSVVAFIALSILFPIAGLWLSGLVSKVFGKHP